MPLVQLDQENADRDLTSIVTVLTDTPSATENRQCQAFVAFGDGAKDLDGTGGDFQVTVTVGGQTVEPNPQTVTFSTAVRAAVWTTPFPVLANDEVIVRVLSPNGADTDVDVTATLFDIPVGDVIDKTGFSLAATGLDLILSTATGMVAIAKAVWDRVLTGATHNIASSAGRRLRGVQAFGDYANGALWFDSINGVGGTVDYENATVQNPSNSMADLLTIAGSLNMVRIMVAPGSTVTLAAALDGFSVIGHNWTLALGGQSIISSHFFGANVTGTSTGAGCDFHDCDIGTATIAPCTVIASRFTSNTGGGFTMQIAGNYTFQGCASDVAGNATPIFTFPASGNTFMNDRAGSGGRQYEGMTSNDVATIEGWGQFVEGTCSGGAVTIRGCLTTSGVSNITITDDARFDVTQVADSVWDEVLTAATHNVSTSAGRRLRDIASDIVFTGDVVSSTANTVTLDASASTVDGSYDPSDIIITEGTGDGQVRAVLEYFGTGANGNADKTAILDRDWKVEPDGTSKITIAAINGSLSTNEGQLRGGSTTTAILNSLASTVDNTYNGQIIQFRSGTGQDQSSLILSYDALPTPTITFCTLDTAVDATTGYMIIPVGTVSLAAIQNDEQSAIDLKDFADAGYDPDTNKVQGVVLTDTATTITNKVTPIDTDGVAFADAMKALMAAGFGVAVRNDPASEIIFKARDGTTTVVTVALGTERGERDTSTIA